MLVDGEVVAREILVMWKRKGTRGFMWKVDFAEANYLLDMDFLWMSMTKRGFLTKWVVWVKKCFTSHSFLVLVNWHPLKGGGGSGRDAPLLLSFSSMLWMPSIYVLLKLGHPFVAVC